MTTTDPEATAERTEHGWIMPDGTYLCDGCNVRGVHEHRCHGSDAAWADARQVCTCPAPGCPRP